MHKLIHDHPNTKEKKVEQKVEEAQVTPDAVQEVIEIKDVTEPKSDNTPAIISSSNPTNSAINSSKKIKDDEVIPLLNKTLSDILQHKDPAKIPAADLEIISDCLEQVILRDISMQVLVASKMGVLIKQFYDFVHMNPQFKVLDIITRCAFKKLKRRVCEMLFGVTKTLQYHPAIKQEEVKEDKEPAAPLSKESPATSAPPRIKRKEKTLEKEASQKAKKEERKRWYTLRTREVAPKMGQQEIDENVHKPPINPRLRMRVMSELSKLLQDVR